jgi:hypothetical protein
MPKVIIGVSWYSREDYPRARAIMADAHVLPETYEAWRELAEPQERNVKATGVTVVRAIINPDEFSAWCAARRLTIDAKARATFANEVAARHLNH